MKHPIIALAQVLVIVGPLSTSHAGVLLPGDLAEGEPYQLLIVTAGERDATSPDIEHYNQFVSQEALTGVNWGLPANASWRAVASTPAVDASTNAPTYHGIPIYNSAGKRVANGQSDLWDGSLDTGVAYDQNGEYLADGVWTGTLWSGAGWGSVTLGDDSKKSTGGWSTKTNENWIGLNMIQPQSRGFHLYGLSSVVTRGSESVFPWADPKTHVLSVGVRSESPLYEDTESWERFDIGAERVADAFWLRRGTESVAFRPLGTSSTFASNRTALTTAIRNAEERVSPGDTFVFYINAHGVPVQVPTVVDNYTEDELTANVFDEGLLLSYADQGADGYPTDKYFTDDDLYSLFNTSKWAQVNKLFIMDTCHAHGFWGGSTADGDTGDLSRIPRTAILAACGETEESASSRFHDPVHHPGRGWGCLGEAVANAVPDFNGGTFGEFADAVDRKGQIFAGTTGYMCGFAEDKGWGAERTITWQLDFDATNDFDFYMGRAVPEPSSLAIWCCGVFMAAWCGRSRKRRK